MHYYKYDNLTKKSSLPQMEIKIALKKIKNLMETRYKGLIDQQMRRITN
jgi:hypothetical protein